MPTVSPNSKVLVTGANGFVALWVIKTLLERGYSVRAAVRAESKGGHLKELFKGYDNKLELVVVPDMTSEGAWDEAVKGVEAIEHTATPVDFSNPMPKPETFIDPAIKGVIRVLESAAKNPEIKRVVVTSSMAAVTSDTQTPRVYTEEDYNDGAIKVVEEKGDQAGVGEIYSASKTLAERAAWDFMKQNKGQISWDLTMVTPPMVVGPPLGVVKAPTDLNGSLFMFWMYLLSDGPKAREQLSQGSAIIDVRDLAEFHVRSLETEKAGGERIFAIARSCIWQDLLDVANSLNLPGRKLQTGFPDLDRKTADVSTEKAKRIFGDSVKYRSLEETIKDTLELFAKSGF